MSAKQMEVDVLVLGGGAAGVNAAMAAAGQGLKTLLVEAQGCLGGSRTATGVDTFYGFYTPGVQVRRIVGGLPWEIVERLQQVNASFERANTYGAGTGITYDVEQLKIVYESAVLESGAKLLYHTFACQIAYQDGEDGRQLTSVTLANKGGLTEVKAQAFIDTTGDADIAAMAGAPFDLRDPGERQSLTTIFFLAGVNVETAQKTKHIELVEKMKQAKQSGRFDLTREDGSWHITPNPGVIQANMVRVSNVDATDPFALTLAEVEGRKQTAEYVNFLKSDVPGFEHAFLIATSQHIGVRETRRIIGEYILTEDDVVEARQFDDAIACCGAPVEVHHAGSETRWAYVGGDGFYQIPYRSLLPQRVENLIVAGRSLSATHGAQASARNSAQCMAMGHAAGLAADLAIKSGIPFRKVDVKQLQQHLLAQGAII